ncbi:unnamed protein product [Ambrosiozyma monospora]|uniref:Unnamed protein product n=1 Tax=Ambrosiozyma monospora TaxID=43982 RepID=A0ACB5TEA8_AMBMO|nr:unnamed protein product [Ambrosiozyma monospora]
MIWKRDFRILVDLEGIDLDSDRLNQDLKLQKREVAAQRDMHEPKGQSSLYLKLQSSRGEVCLNPAPLQAEQPSMAAGLNDNKCIYRELNSSKMDLQVSKDRASVLSLRPFKNALSGRRIAKVFNKLQESDAFFKLNKRQAHSLDVKDAYDLSYSAELCQHT